LGPYFDTIQWLFLTLIHFVNSLPTSDYWSENRELTLSNTAWKRSFFALGLIIFLSTPVAWAQNIESIQIKGNKKIEKDAISEKLISRLGQSLDIKSIRDDVRALFSTGYFQDIEVSKTKGPKGGVILTYRVVEKPSISQVEYRGNSEIDDDELAELTKIKIFEIIDYGKINRGVSDIQKAYEEKGYFLAKVTYEVIPDERDGVQLIFNVEENDQVMVKRVTFIGNDKVPASEIKGRMQTQEGGAFSGLSGSGTFKQDAFEQDTQMIQFLYFNMGYVQAKVSRPEVTVTPDKKGIYITVRVEEGEQFDTGEVSFSGDLMFPTEELAELAEIGNSKTFVYEIVQKDIQAFTAKYGDLGYAYTNVIPRTFIREEERKVDIVYEFDKGKKVYYGTINVIGNTRTRDKVVRRELRIGEGELYNESRKRESMANVRRLGFFEEVEFITKTPPGRDDLMDIDIMVKERNTGSFQLGAGYSSFSGVIFNGQLNQMNFMGKGQNVGFQVDHSRIQKRYRINFTDPYFMDTWWSVGFDIYRNETFFPGLFQEKVEGAAIRVGHPIYSRYLYGFLRYKVDQTAINMERGPNATDVLNPKTAEGITSSLTASIEYDKRDDRFAPSDGVHTSASFEYAGIGGGLAYSKGDVFFRWYYNIFWNLILRTNFSYGFIQPNSGQEEVPFTKLYRLGGPFNLRGYDFAQVGRRQFSPIHFDWLRGEEQDADGIPFSRPNTNPLPDDIAFQRAQVVVGGRQQALAMVELEFPLVKEAGIRGVMFYDAGLADNIFVGSAFQEDIGFGVRWFSPIGPLRFEWGFPRDPRPEFGEDSSQFHFAIGAPF
jgi:outer membrane protein insertion porin family